MVNRSVLMVTPNLYPQFGGPPVTIVKMADSLAAYGFSVNIAFAAIEDVSDCKELATKLGGTHRRVNYSGFRLALPSLVLLKWGLSWSLFRYALSKSKEVDIVLIHQVWGLPFFCLLNRGLRAKAVQIPHESLTFFDVRKKSWKFTTVLKHLQIAFSSLYQNRIIFSSKLERDNSYTLGPRALRDYCYHPLGAVEGQERQLRSGEGGLKIGYIGRLHHKKNIDLLMRAMAMIPDAELHIAGTGGIEGDLRALMKELVLEKRVIWHGFIDSKLKPEFFASIDLCAVPSEFECFGQSAAEALIAGCPLMATRQVGCAEDLVDRQSVLTVDATVESVIQAIEYFKALNADDRYAFGQNGREEARLNFDNNKFVQTVLRVCLLSENEGCET